MEGRGTTDAIFILRQLQEKHINAGKNLYFAFVDLEKAFDRVPRQVIWWAMRKLGVQEWLIRWVESLYRGARSSVRIGDTYSEEFQVKVGVHQGSVLSPLLFITVLEVLSREFCTGCPWEFFYADDLVIMSKTLNELLEKLKTWKKGMEAKGLKQTWQKPNSWWVDRNSTYYGTQANTLAPSAAKELAVMPFTVPDVHIGYTKGALA